VAQLESLIQRVGRLEELELRKAQGTAGAGSGASTTAASTGAATSKLSAGCRSKSADSTPILPATEAGSYEEKTATMSSLGLPVSLTENDGMGSFTPMSSALLSRSASGGQPPPSVVKYGLPPGMPPRAPSKCSGSASP
jgi:hypothetical protein